MCNLIFFFYNSYLGILKMLAIFFISICICFHQSNSLFLNNNACPKYDQYPTVLINKNCYNNPSVMSNTPELIQTNGYNSEEHKIVTDDGYILLIFRVFKGSMPKGQPIYFQHGFAHDSSCWVFSGNQSLPFYLVEKGYDVWLGNIRTTQYAKETVNFTSQNPNYWNFSLDEMASFDVRNSLQKVADVTGKAGEIIYIGHSLGTTLFFMYSSEFVDDNLVKSMIALSPIVYYRFPDELRPIIPLLFPITNALQSLNITSILNDIQPVHEALQIVCKLAPYICKIGLELIFGKSYLFPASDLTAYLSYVPDSIGIKQTEHSMQLLYANELVKYDYGKVKNLEIYGTEKAPLYNLENIKVPVYLLYGKNDAIINKETTDKIFNKLVESSYRYVNTVPIENNVTKEQFNHIDWFFGKNVQSLFYEDLYKILETFSSV